MAEDQELVEAVVAHVQRAVEMHRKQVVEILSVAHVQVRAALLIIMKVVATVACKKQAM